MPSHPSCGLLVEQHDIGTHALGQQDGCTLARVESIQRSVSRKGRGVDHQPRRRLPDPLLDRRRGAAARQLGTDLVGDAHGREDPGEKIRLANQDEVAEGRGVRDCSHGMPDCRKASRSRARSAWS
jgi:hypothetical protein